MIEMKPKNVTTGATLMCIALNTDGSKCFSVELPPLIRKKPKTTTAKPMASKM